MHENEPWLDYAEFIEERYDEQLASIARGEAEELEVNWTDVFSFDQELAEAFLQSPEYHLNGLKKGFVEAELPPAIEGVMDASMDRADVPARVVDLDNRARTIRSLRAQDVGHYVAINCQVDIRSSVFPHAEEIPFRCVRCENLVRVEQHGEQITEPHECVCDRNGPFEVHDEEASFRDYQRLEVSDPPEVAQGAGDSLSVHVYDELTGQVEGGDRVTIYGRVVTESIVDEQNPSRNRPIELHAHAIEHDETGFTDITPDRLEEIQDLSERDDLFDLLTDSVAPGLVSDSHLEAVKLAMVLQLMGGVERDYDLGYKRGNINMLLVGPPGTGKSQILGAANDIAPKSIKVSGKGARPAGMTATAKRDEVTGEWTLAAGALPKASGGIACIDEFDKMQEETKRSLHEALEDQEISVAKADIQTTIPAKAAVLGAANPEGMTFDRFTPLKEQIDIDEALISRFDLIFGLRNQVDEEKDRATAKYQHDQADPNRPDPEPAIDLDLLRQYIAYARQNVHPSYESDEVRDELVEFYVDLREETDGEDEEGTGSLRPVGPRINELLRRLAQASARARLSEDITMEDAERVQDLFKRTLGEVGLDEEGNVDGAALIGGSTQTQHSRIQDLTDIVDEVAEEHDGGAPTDEVIARAAEAGIAEDKAEREVEKLQQKGELYSPSNGGVLTT